MWVCVNTPSSSGNPGANTVDSSAIVNGSITGIDIQNNSIDATTKLSTTCADTQILEASGGNLVCANQSVGADHLGNHTATEDLDLDTFQLVGNGGASGISILNNGNVGVGVSSPTATLDINRFSNGLPASSGGNDPAVQVRMGARSIGAASVLDIGSVGAFGYWLQTRAFGDHSINYPFFINPNGGNVGVGVTNALQALHVGGVVMSDGNEGSATVGGLQFAGNYAGNNILNTYGSKRGTGHTVIGYSAKHAMGADGYVSSVENFSSTREILRVGGGFEFLTAASAVVSIDDPIALTSRMVIENGGNVGIGTPSPGEALEVNGNVLADNVAVPSDIKFKDNREPIRNSLKKIKKLTGYEYVWNNKSGKKAGSRAIGVIAQEVESQFKLLVNIQNKGAKDEYKSVNYQGLIAPLINAVKELDDLNLTQDMEIDFLKAENKKLKKEFLKLKAVIRELAVSR